MLEGFHCLITNRTIQSERSKWTTTPIKRDLLQTIQELKIQQPRT